MIHVSRFLIFCMVVAILSNRMASAAPFVWTLESATRRVLEVAPERHQSDAVVQTRQEELTLAGSWPNPSIDLRADDRVGQMSGQGGTSLSQLALSQPLPFRRLARQRTAAESSLAAAQANRNAQSLLLER